MIKKKNNLDYLVKVYFEHVYSILSYNSFKIYLKLLSTKYLISIFQKNINECFELFFDINLNRENLYLLDFLVKKDVKMSKILDIDIALIENKIFDRFLALSKTCFQFKKLSILNNKLIKEFITQLIQNFEQIFVLYDITKYFLTSKQNFTSIFDRLSYLDIIKLEIQVSQSFNKVLPLTKANYDDLIALTAYIGPNRLSINLVKFLNKLLKIKNLPILNCLNKNKNVKKVLNLKNFKQIQQYEYLKFSAVNFYLTKFSTKTLTKYYYLIKEIVTNKQRLKLSLTISTKNLKQKMEKIFHLDKFGQNLKKEKNIFIQIQNILVKIFQKLVYIKNNISNHLFYNTTYFISNFSHLHKHDICLKEQIMCLIRHYFSSLILQKSFRKIQYNLVLVQTKNLQVSLTKRDKNIFDFYSKNDLSFEEINLENLLEIKFNEYLDIQLKTVFFKTAIILLTIIFRKIIKNYLCNFENLILEDSTLFLSKNFDLLNLEFIDDNDNLNLYLENYNNSNLELDDEIDSGSLLFEEYCLILEDLFLYCLDEDQTLIGQSFIDILRKHYRYIIKMVKKARNNTIIQSTQNILRKEHEPTEDELYENELYNDEYEPYNEEQNAAKFFEDN